MPEGWWGQKAHFGGQEENVVQIILARIIKLGYFAGSPSRQRCQNSKTKAKHRPPINTHLRTANPKGNNSDGQRSTIGLQWRTKK